MAMNVKHWQDPVNLVLGLWMLVSPWVLAYQAETNPTWNAVALGILIAASALGLVAQSVQFVRLLVRGPRVIESGPRRD